MTVAGNGGGGGKKKTYEGGLPYYEATGVTSGQQHGPTHDSEPPAAVARPSRRRRSRRHRESNLPDVKCGTMILCLGSGWGFFGGRVVVLANTWVTVCLTAARLAEKAKLSVNGGSDGVYCIPWPLCGRSEIRPELRLKDAMTSLAR
jgi:hypothetical protein